MLLAALPVVLFGQLVLRDSAAWLWLLPALGFTAAVLGLSTWFGPWRPAVAISLAWVVITFAAARLHTIWGLSHTRYLVLYVVMLVAGSLVFVVRVPPSRHHRKDPVMTTSTPTLSPRSP